MTERASHYRLEAVLGQGGSATTWKAVNTRTGQPCALKKLHLPQLASWKDLERFEREVGALRHLSHDAIPRFLDAWQSAEPPEAVLVQEFVPGRNLRQWVESGRRFTEAEVVAIGIQLADVLAYLHGFASPIVHRDLKPSNILLDDEHLVHLIDFGAVPASLGSEGLTVTGTFGYMPIEQAEGRAVPASDLYALGATMIYLLTGCSPADLPRRGLKIDFRASCQVSRGLANVLDKLIEPDVSRRYHEAVEVAADLRRLQRMQQDARAWLLSWLTLRNRPRAILLLCLLIGGLGILWNVLRTQRATPVIAGPVSKDATLIGEFGSWQPGSGSLQLLEPAPSILALAEAKSGEVWGIASDRLLRLRDRPQLWANHDLTGSHSPFRQLALAGETEIWLGKFDGTLFRWRPEQEGRPVAIAPPKPGVKLSALGAYQGRVVAAFGGSVWSWQGAEFSPLGELDEEIAVFHTDSENRLWAAGGRTLYRYEAGQWRTQASTGSRYEARIRHMAARGDQVWLGLEKGLLELSLTRNLSAPLSGVGPITGIAGDPGQGLWLASSDTFASGLLWLKPGEKQPRSLGWREGLPADRFEALLIDRKGQLWASAGITSGGGLIRAPLKDVEALLAKPATTGVIPGRDFVTACAAWDALRPAQSPQLAGETRGRQTRVFFNRHQVCPYGAGYRRDDGALLFTSEGKLQLWHGPRLELRDLPERHVSTQELLLARDDSTWHSRIFPYVVERGGPGGWSQLGEGFSGKSSAQFLEIRAGTLLAAVEVEDQLPLQRFAKGRWQSLGLATGETMTPRRLIELRSGELALATDKGLYLIAADLKSFRRVEGLPHQDVQAVSEDAQGRLWIVYHPYGRGRGLSLHQPDGKVRHLDSRSGLVPDRFENLVIDARQRVWLMRGAQAISVYEAAALEAAFSKSGRQDSGGER